MNRRAIIKREIEIRQRQLAMLDRFSDEDPFEDGAVLAVDIRYPDRDKTYHYAVVKAVGEFYVTGCQIYTTPGPFTWESFVCDFLGRAESVIVYWAPKVEEL